MWMVPPDIGTTVMCIFIDGDPNSGYWFGCVADKFQNHMVPGIAASQKVAMTPEQERKYGTRFVPVAEFLKKSRDTSIAKPDSFTKPIHPFADRLLAQGLLTDTIRGVTSSSARREVPSSVFGISTPGPLDTRPGAKRAEVGYERKVNVPVSRLGGSTFVMDDGDKDGQNELVRIRTRTGHQILLHNSHDLIYIANSKGTAWIELTSNGKIDIYAQDSVSIHTENDFNFRADRDINIEAGRNMNISVGGTMQTDVSKDHIILVDGSGKIFYSGKYDHTVDDVAKISIANDLHIGSGANIFQTAIADIHQRAGSNMYQQSGSQFNVRAGGLYKETASQIHMNSDGNAAVGADGAQSAEIPDNLPKYNLPNRQKSAGWDNGRFYKADDIQSIMKRVPTHEPWDHHESINASQFSQSATDSSTSSPTKSQAKANSANGSGNTGPGTVDDPPANYNRAEMPSDWVKDDAFIAKVQSVAKTLNCSYIDLLCCMAFETGRTMDPAIRNSIGATGLIQFIRPTAKALGTTTDALAAMTRVEQMDWVLKYFQSGPIRRLSSVTLEDLYMAILWPVAVGKPNSYVLFQSPSTAYQQNRGLDLNKDGQITKEEAASKVRDQLGYIRGQLLKVKDQGGVVTDSGGSALTDGSGNPIRYGPYPPK